MAQSTKSNIAELNTDVTKQMAILRDDIANLTATVAEYGKAQGDIVKAAATSKANNVVENGTAAADAVKAKATKSYSDAEDAVRANPGAAVGIAAGIGFLVGMISARR
ncbi:DUF883 family protein [Sulfitobacter sp. M57]|uniref:DUF883 family protein n=1 Tax=unclassified Sulfitobacter TaxID=196795 RepID=UPI0023E10F1E|nr:MULTISPECIES: DUF883 C-terminal domain-containing protein [unclassified Sulfitobacter]MDF3414378.1 DUF883 family protein [Sulfitobacter sp. KE5]MDF3420340.1 DUF883 family protein [Sulfitobacter sp. KE43]MDF3432924.1 DUF883 family protein [Sulfitobacter sp. KE42]MDF3458564.1 DUF883 family protein [Sulfitobacter sp. S74]MDF3462464.1 DUF883 family protein [Sulfitobacter sp. Ks18]